MTSRQGKSVPRLPNQSFIHKTFPNFIKILLAFGYPSFKSLALQGGRTTLSDPASKPYFADKTKR